MSVISFERKNKYFCTHLICQTLHYHLKICGILEQNISLRYTWYHDKWAPPQGRLLIFWGYKMIITIYTHNLEYASNGIDERMR